MILPRLNNSAWRKNPRSCGVGMEDVRSCFEDVSYSYTDVVLNTSHKVQTESFFVSEYIGMAHAVYPPLGSIKTFFKKSFRIFLNPMFQYKLGISDPQYKIWTPNPLSFPRTLLDIETGAGQVFLYFNVTFQPRNFYKIITDCQVVEHDNLDTESRHCRAALDYKLADCLRRRSDAEVGCQTFWTNLTDVPWCENSSRILENMKNYNRMINKERTRLYRDTGCLDPCHYFEYKVGKTYIFSN